MHHHNLSAIPNQVWRYFVFNAFASLYLRRSSSLKGWRGSWRPSVRLSPPSWRDVSWDQRLAAWAASGKTPAPLSRLCVRGQLYGWQRPLAISDAPLDAGSCMNRGVPPPVHGRTGSRSFLTECPIIDEPHKFILCCIHCLDAFFFPPYQPSDVTPLYLLLRGPLISWIDYRMGEFAGTVTQVVLCDKRRVEIGASLAPYWHITWHISLLAPTYADDHTCFNESHHISIAKQKTVKVWLHSPALEGIL